MTITSDESFIILTTVTLSFEAELNLPYYPLLRRNVDCIIALDASADSQVSKAAGLASLDSLHSCRTYGLREQNVKSITPIINSMP